MDPKTIQHGLMELELKDDLSPSRVRKKVKAVKWGIERQLLQEENYLKPLADLWQSVRRQVYCGPVTRAARSANVYGRWGRR